MLDKIVKLSNGYEIPSVGYGTWLTPDGEIAVNAVKAAIEKGYTHIDTAAYYGNERSIGQAIRESGVPREKLFITSKVWNSDRGYDKTLAAFEKTLADLKTDYLDLYLIHWPANEKQFANWKEINADTWRALEDLYQQGKIRSIGLSNFWTPFLSALLETAKIVPMVNQIEYHPGFMQEDTVAYCKERGITVEAWSPLGRGKLLANETLTKIAEKNGVTTAQVIVRWCLQNDIIPLPKSTNPERIAKNLDVFSFSLSDEDMATINAMEYCGGSRLDPTKVDF